MFHPMHKDFDKILNPPTFEDPEKTRQAYVLNIILIALVVSLAFGMLGNLVGGVRLPMVYISHILGIMLGLILLWLMRRGTILLSSYILMFSAMAITTLSAISIGTVRAPVITIYLLIIVGSGLLINRRTMILNTVLSILIVLGLVLAETNALLQPKSSTASIVHWFTYTIFFILAAILVSVALNSITAALERAKQENTERAETERALRASQEVFYKAFYSSPVAMTIEDEDLNLIDVNDAFVETFGYPRETLIGQPSSRFDLRANPQDAQRDRQLMEEQGFLRDHEIKIRRKSGETGYLLLSREPIELDGKLCFLSLGLDITDRKLAEEAQRLLNINLEQRVEERTIQLERAIHELESFSYSVSHDLRAPLRAIDGYSRLMLDEEGLSNDALQYLENVRQSAQRMGRIIDDLLQLSRLSRVHMRQTTVSLSEIAQEILRKLQETQPERSMNIKIQPGLAARGDPDLLYIALENLLENAWKFTNGKNQPMIEFRKRKLSELSCIGLSFSELRSNEKLKEMPPIPATWHLDTPVYFVRDNGAGFDMTYADKLFQPFQRLHKLDEFDGTGIGLANVKRVINLHGGQIWARAMPGQGACFIFTLSENQG